MLAAGLCQRMCVRDSVRVLQLALQAPDGALESNNVSYSGQMVKTRGLGAGLWSVIRFGMNPSSIQEHLFSHSAMHRLLHSLLRDVLSPSLAISFTGITPVIS